MMRRLDKRVFLALAALGAASFALAPAAEARARHHQHQAKSKTSKAGKSSKRRHHARRHHKRRLLPVSANAPNAELVFDAASGRILHVRNPAQEVYPASLTKMMTLYLTFRAVREGWLSLDERTVVSAHAAAAPPTALGLRPGDTPSIDDLVRAAVTESANDAARALAEEIDRRFALRLLDRLRLEFTQMQNDHADDIAETPQSPEDAADWDEFARTANVLADSISGDGSEADFARLMTLQARLLGMDSTRFKNASGLPDPEQISTAPDMAMLAYAIVNLPAEYYGYFSLRYFDYGGRNHHNHNMNFLTQYEGADGIKTGYTQLGGFNVADSAKRGDKRLIAIVLGRRSHADREADVKAMMNAAFALDALPAPDTDSVGGGWRIGDALDLPDLPGGANKLVAAKETPGGASLTALSAPPLTPFAPAPSAPRP